MNDAETLVQSDDEEYIPVPVVYTNIHDSSKCIFCNVKSGEYMRVKGNAWRRLFSDIDIYSRTGNEAMINKIIKFYEKVIRIPCNARILLGDCGSGFKPYPQITVDTIRGHTKTFSVKNVKIEKLKALTEISRELEKYHLIGVDPNGNRIIDQKNLALYLKVAETIGKMSQNLKK